MVVNRWQLMVNHRCTSNRRFLIGRPTDEAQACLTALGGGGVFSFVPDPQPRGVVQGRAGGRGEGGGQFLTVLRAFLSSLSHSEHLK